MIDQENLDKNIIDNELLENLTLQQYDHIFKALIENKDLKTIKKIIGK